MEVAGPASGSSKGVLVVACRMSRNDNLLCSPPGQERHPGTCFP